MNKIQEAIVKNQLSELVKQGDFNKAELLCSQLLKALPKDVDVWYTFGQVLQKLNKSEQAVKALLNATQPASNITRDALKLAVHISQEHKLYALGFMAGQALLQNNPVDVETYFTHGMFGSCLNLDYLANHFYQKAIDINPNDKRYRLYNAKALNHLGRTTEALEQYQAAIDLDDRDDEPYFRRLFAQNYSQYLEEETVVQSHKAYGERLEKRFPKVDKFKPRELSSRVKIGYVSKDFATHSVAYFFLAMIQGHDSKMFEVYCYSDGAPADEDAITEKIKAGADHWVPSLGLSDNALCQRIRKDRIDILVDLLGMTGNPRMSVYAQRAAPVQINYLGYPNTCGLSRMDYRITDNWTDPVGLTEKHNTETLIRVPSGFLCYTPELPQTTVVDLPALESHVITFGSFNVFPKITDKMLKLWTEILLSVPDSKLLIKAKLFLEKQNNEIVQQRFEALGISKERLILIAFTPDTKSHLEVYNQVDIHLDTFPYNGTTTTCEALWQGVPTVTLAGDTHRSRVGLSILNQVGLEDFIAYDASQYVEIAVSVSKDLKKLSVLRQGMRARVQNSKLLNAKLFMAEYEAELKKLI